MLSDLVTGGRERLRDGRARCRQQHDEGSPGALVSTRISDLYDDLVMEVWDQACRDHFDGETPKGLALVAHGGFGRRDLAPYSDADLMLIVRSRNTAAGEKIAQALTRDLVDIGLDVGFSLRSPAEACHLPWADPVIFTSLTESRFLAGSLKVFTQFFQSLRQGALRRSGRLIRDVIAARHDERRQWGDTNYLLAPNVKKSRGGLRDIQLIRWIGFARYGEVDLEQLLRLGALPEEDYRKIRRAYDFLIRLRNELHFRDGRARDVLGRAAQMTIADAWGYRGRDGVLPVEEFMQHYFDVTREVRYSARFFADDNRSRPWIGQLWERLRAQHIGDGVWMGPTHVWVDDNHLASFTSSLPKVLRMMSLANHHNLRIGHRTWQAIRKSMQDRESAAPDAESIGAFLSLLSHGGRLAPLLRRLHELRIIEQLIPEFRRIRGMLQFNEYHKYTVDAHSIRAVEAATDFADDQSSMGRRYRRLKDKTLLHLALLIHDIGKGHEEDHCIVGARIARDVGKRLDLDRSSIEVLEWLVLKHLAVNNVAFRHDLNDPQIVISFAKEVGSIRRLELLIVHAVADLAAVGPDVLTDWKMKLIEDLYLRTRRYFESGDLELDERELADEIRVQVKHHLVDDASASMSMRILNEIPLSLLRREQPQELAEQINQAAAALDDGVNSFCFYRYDDIASAIRYIVIFRQGKTRVGIFARVAAAFMSCEISILRAEILTLGDLVWDEFWVSDQEHPQDPPQSRIDEVTHQVTHLLDHPDASPPQLKKKWSVGAADDSGSVNVLPTKIGFDNDTLDRYTILSVFAYDQRGLLYRIATVLSELRIVIHFAKIDTHLDQIADVFYVTEEDGRQLADSRRQNAVRDALLAVIANACQL